ncbi:NERD domain-containing protein [Shewanella maritima]|uniref:NERD domain-containing protein n=1 Tax=Shewanella maritima TaxID=2520507 RepID=A0A411PGL2_9GAMM|nr:nuclease-related domain-containing protein [Shewanella maritima]QBF82711.1 NERD domain-containing protein [Shewanella maritima]
MILKTKSSQTATSAMAIAGQKQEHQVAFYLRRAFKDNPEILVINDFKFTFNDETAQIDHLIIYPYGFVLVESKSIKGNVKVNKHGEWTRSFNQKWSGIPSPIKQVELQQDLLHSLLDHHRLEVLGKFLGIKQGFGGRCWDHLCVVSSDAIIDRDTMPKAVSSKLVKSEFLVDKLKKLMKIRNKLLRKVNVYDTRPYFNQQELDSISHFLIEQDISQQESPASNDKTADEYMAIPSTPQQVQVPTAVFQHTIGTEAGKRNTLQVTCKHCGESSNYIPMYGKFGYYIKCNECTKNTPMKQACPQCQSKNTKVKKHKDTYTLNCSECLYEQRMISR